MFQIVEVCVNTYVTGAVGQAQLTRTYGVLGGRTAWASVVTVYGRQIQAQFWYDGRNLNNAKEDAAEKALLWLSNNLNLGQGW